MAGDVLEERVSGIGTDGLPAFEELLGRGRFWAMRPSGRIGLDAGSLQVIAAPELHLSAYRWRNGRVLKDWMEVSRALL